MGVQTLQESPLNQGAEAAMSGVGAAVGEMVIPEGVATNAMVRPGLIGLAAAAGGMLSNQIFDKDVDKTYSVRADPSAALKTAAGTSLVYYFLKEQIGRALPSETAKEMVAFLCGMLGDFVGAQLPKVPLIGDIFKKPEETPK
mgnify:FL=1